MNDGNSQQASCVYALPQKRSNCPNPLMSPESALSTVRGPLKANS